MEAVIFCGIQASGKSTFFKERFFQTRMRLSVDLLRTHQREASLPKTSLNSRQAFVIDNANRTRAEQELYTQTAKRHQLRIIDYFFKSATDVSTRNSLRSGKELIPAPEEGYDELFYVELGDEGFVIKAGEHKPNMNHDSCL